MIIRILGGILGFVDATTQSVDEPVDSSQHTMPTSERNS